MSALCGFHCSDLWKKQTLRNSQWFRGLDDTNSFEKDGETSAFPNFLESKSPNERVNLYEKENLDFVNCQQSSQAFSKGGISPILAQMQPIFSEKNQSSHLSRQRRQPFNLRGTKGTQESNGESSGNPISSRNPSFGALSRAKLLI